MARTFRNRRAVRAVGNARSPLTSAAQAVHVPATFSAVGLSHCGWCGRPLQSLPFQMDAVVLCADCYGAHHYEDRPGEVMAPGPAEEPAAEVIVAVPDARALE